MKKWWRNRRPYVLGPLIFLVARAIGITLRIRCPGYERYRDHVGGVIFAGWHGRTFAAATFFRKQGLWTIISQSKDGDMQNIVFRGFGFNTIRGSTGRGGVRAAAESIRVLRKGARMAFTPDGPRGPSGVVQMGIILMAQKSGATLVPVGVSARRRWLAPSWDRYMIPKPFSEVVMVFGSPHVLASGASPDEVEAFRLGFEREMHELEQEAERKMGHA